MPSTTAKETNSYSHHPHQRRRHHRRKHPRRKETEDDRSSSRARVVEGDVPRDTNVRGTKQAAGKERRVSSKSVPKRRVTQARRPKSASDLPSSSKAKSPLMERPSSSASRRVNAPKTAEPVRSKTDAVKNEKRSSGFMNALFGNGSSTTEKKITCLTCFSDDVPISRSAKLSCSHRMCYGCLKRIFIMSVSDPQHMPPRCCTSDHIPLKHVDKLFDYKFKKRWNKKYEEYMTQNRIYCPAKGCGEWIKPDNIHQEFGSGRRYGKCGRCKTRVCIICNGKLHRGKFCPKDEGTERFIEIAEEEGWQKCYNCSAMVELKEGCNHMKCRCTAEFCMICGAKWKSCECPWFNYDNMDGDVLNQMNIPDARRAQLRHQMEVERQREQERRDEMIARRLQQGLSVDDEHQDGSDGDNEPNRNDETGATDGFPPIRFFDPPPLPRPRRNRPSSPIQEANVEEDDVAHFATHTSSPTRPRRPPQRRLSVLSPFFGPSKLHTTKGLNSNSKPPR